ncbi:hypothetical protein BT96DRAFT_1050699 [Gymnopus androsaceus JB14]|uniref:Uncharacterized protein n=1 Tax=Gymnopus androsaceus JB14 TaxID=1447944 RepID=A0A6A4H5V0_9AGAR|nr:hypothetical protein BT96DRAFT_1050699 [Gymnopus androsaceus JB14]
MSTPKCIWIGPYGTSTPQKQRSNSIVPLSQSPAEITPKKEPKNLTVLPNLQENSKTEDNEVDSQTQDDTQAQSPKDNTQDKTQEQREPSPAGLNVPEPPEASPQPCEPTKLPSSSHEALSEIDPDETLWDEPELITGIVHDHKLGPLLVRCDASGNPLSPQSQYKGCLAFLSKELNNANVRCCHLELNLKAASAACKLANLKLSLSERNRIFAEKENELLRKVNQVLESKHSCVQDVVQMTVRDLIHLQADL